MEGEKKHCGLLIWWPAGMLAMLLVVYPLSAGPFAALQRAVGFPEWMESVYCTLYHPLMVVFGWLPRWVFYLFLDYSEWWTNWFP